MKIFAAFVAAAAVVAASAGAEGISAARQDTPLYDGPSEKSRVLFVLGDGYPLRLISEISGWRKAAAHDGTVGWIRDGDSVPADKVVITAQRAAVRTDPNDDADAMFLADAGVVLNRIGDAIDGWIPVRHDDGESGFVRSADVWEN